MSKLILGHKFYVLGRTSAITLSLLFALYYSRELGVLSRSYLAMIMTSGVLIGVALTSGTTLTLRNLGIQRTPKDNISSFHLLVVIEMLIGSVLFLLTMLTFSTLKYSLHPTLIITSVFYFIASITHLIVFELLIASKAFRFLALSEIVTILLQVFFFLFFTKFVDISIASKVLVSFILSYVVVVSACLFYLKFKFGYYVNFSNPLVFFRLTKGNHTLGTVLGIVDRFDRLIIAWFLPIALLGKYAIMSSAISFFRFVPETISKLIVATKSEILPKYFQFKFVWVGVLIALTASVLLLQSFIEFTLGQSWLLPLSVTYVFALQELARGMFQLSANYKIVIGKSSHAHRAAMCLLLISGPFAYILSRWKGLIGVPLGFLLTYIFVLLLMKERSI